LQLLTIVKPPVEHNDILGSANVWLSFLNGFWRYPKVLADERDLAAHPCTFTVGTSVSL
jgi:hypothetical protein